MRVKFTDKELAIVVAARKKARGATIVRVAIITAMLVSIALMFVGAVSAAHFAYASIAAVILAVAYPQLGEGPKYEDLVRLLES